PTLFRSYTDTPGKPQVFFSDGWIEDRYRQPFHKSETSTGRTAPSSSTPFFLQNGSRSRRFPDTILQLLTVKSLLSFLQFLSILFFLLCPVSSVLYISPEQPS